MRNYRIVIAAIALGVFGAAVPAAPSAPAVCNCPAAEPPLAGRIVTEVASGGDIAPSITSLGTPATCSNPKAELLSGGCEPEDQTLLDGSLLLLSSKKNDNGTIGPDSWSCAWQNKNTAKTAHILITLTCLNPAP